MVRRDGAELRRMRMQEISQTIMKFFNQVGPSLELSAVMPELQYTTGLTKERIIEYLGIISATGRFEVDVEGNKISRYTAAPEVKEP